VIDVNACMEAACCMTGRSTTASLEVACALPLVQRHFWLSLVRVVRGFIKDYSVSCVGCITASARSYAATGSICSTYLGGGGGCHLKQGRYISDSIRSAII